MATPPSDETKVLFRLLADGEWHLYDDVRNEIARLIPPGKGLRRYEQNVEYKRQYRQDPSYDTSLSEDDRIFYGQRMLAQAVITSWKGRGVIFTGDGSSEPKRLKIKPGAKPWGVELPGAGDDDDGLGVEPDPEQVHAELDKLDGSSESAVASLADLDARELAEYGGMPSEGAEGVQSREEQFDELLAETVDEEVQEPAPGLDSLPAVMVQPEGFTCEGCGGFVLDADQHERWHHAIEGEKSSDDVALFSRSDVRLLIEEVVSEQLDQFQGGMQRWMTGQFAQLESVVAAALGLPWRASRR